MFFFRFIFLALLFICQTYSYPPRLMWFQNNCWTTSAVQLLRNIPPLTETLLRNFDFYVKNKKLESYMRLLRAIQENTDMDYDFKKELQVFLQTACQLTGNVYGEFGYVTDLIKEILKENDLIKTLFCLFEDDQAKNNPYLQLGMDGENPKYSLAKLVTDYMDVNQVKLNKEGDYFLFSVYISPESWRKNFVKSDFIVSLEIDLGSYRVNKSSLVYELIGVVVYEKDAADFTIYLEDQFEENPQWYYVNSLRNVIKPVRESDIEKWGWQNKSTIKSGADMPYVFLYKKKDYSKILAKSFEEIARRAL